MKTIKQIFSAIFALALCVTAQAQSWNNAYGMGNPGGDIFISGRGVPFSVVQSVQSNAHYFVVSDSAIGAPLIDQVLFKPSAVADTIGWYTSTNSWTCASNQNAGTTNIWITTTNSAMATNDILVLKSASSDSYQMLVVCGSATDYSGQDLTNALGQVRVKVWNLPTNAIAAGDTLYKMALVSSFTACIPAITNSVNVTNSFLANWLPLSAGVGGTLPIKFAGRTGVPSLLLYSTTSNAPNSGLNLNGQYIPQRIGIR